MYIVHPPLLMKVIAVDKHFNFRTNGGIEGSESRQSYVGQQFWRLEADL
jgi:hypothetical protein